MEVSIHHDEGSVSWKQRKEQLLNQCSIFVSRLFVSDSYYCSEEWQIVLQRDVSHLTLIKVVKDTTAHA